MDLSGAGVPGTCRGGASRPGNADRQQGPRGASRGRLRARHRIRGRRGIARARPAGRHRHGRRPHGRHAGLVPGAGRRSGRGAPGRPGPVAGRRRGRRAGRRGRLRARALQRPGPPALRGGLDRPGPAPRGRRDHPGASPGLDERPVDAILGTGAAGAADGRRRRGGPSGAGAEPGAGGLDPAPPGPRGASGIDRRGAAPRVPDGGPRCRGGRGARRPAVGAGRQMGHRSPPAGSRHPVVGRPVGRNAVFTARPSPEYCWPLPPSGRTRRARETDEVEAMAEVGGALSGGGHRAALFGLGVLVYLADAGKGPDVTSIASVSGGSLTNGFVAQSVDYRALSGPEFSEAVAPFAGQIAQRGTVWAWWPVKAYVAVLGLWLAGTFAVWALPWWWVWRLVLFLAAFLVWAMLAGLRGRLSGLAFART